LSDLQTTQTDDDSLGLLMLRQPETSYAFDNKARLSEIIVWLNYSMQVKSYDILTIFNQKGTPDD
jgi:hypothetical protein